MAPPARPPCHGLLWMRILGIDPRSRAPSMMDLGDDGRIEALALNERRERRLRVGAEVEVGERRLGERGQRRRRRRAACERAAWREMDGARMAGMRASVRRGGREMGSAGLCGGWGMWG